MKIRWGQRSNGGAVKAGHGGWYFWLGLPPTIEFINPQTGDAAASSAWNLRHALWCVRKTAHRQRMERLARNPRIRAQAEAMARNMGMSASEAEAAIHRALGTTFYRPVDHARHGEAWP